MRLSIACLLTLTLAACDKQKPALPQGSEVAGAPHQPTEAAPARGRPEKAPTASFKDAAGRAVSLGAFRGRPLLVNLWATWCAPCIQEMPSIDRLAASEKTRLAVVAVSQDGNGLAAVAPFFAKAKIIALQPYLDPDNALMMALKAETLPTTILYDANGSERWRHVGKVDWDDPAARAVLADTLAGAPVTS